VEAYHGVAGRVLNGGRGTSQIEEVLMAEETEEGPENDDLVKNLTVEELALLVAGSRRSPGQIALLIVMALAIISVFALAAWALLAYRTGQQLLGCEIRRL
jgi:hypothetical protein